MSGGEVTFKNYANISSNLPFPQKANRNEYVVFTSTDSPDYVIEDSRLVCKNPGTWTFVCQYQLYSNSTSNVIQKGERVIDSILDGWIRVNGEIVPGSDATSSSAILSGTNVLVIEYCVQMNDGDSIEFGIRSSSYDKKVHIQVLEIIDENLIGTPSVILTALKLREPLFPSEFKNYANLFSTKSYPLKVNQNEYIEITDTDTNDFVLEGDKVICMNPGFWAITSQYQIYAYNNSDVGKNSEIDVWVNLNDIDIRFSNASSSILCKNELNVLCLVGTLYFEKGDYIKVGIRSTSLDQKFNAGVISYIAPSGILAPSIITTAYKVDYLPMPVPGTIDQFYYNSTNINSFGNFPTKANTNEYIVYDFNGSADFKLDGTKVICQNPGTWSFCSVYECYSFKQSTVGVNSEINGWFSYNGVIVEDSCAIVSVTELAQTNVLVIQYVKELKEGDYIEIGVRSGSLDGQLNAAIRTRTGPTGVVSPCSRLVATKF